jgi:hypothetical protein
MSKGSRNRTTNFHQFGENFDAIQWPAGSRAAGDAIRAAMFSVWDEPQGVVQDCVPASAYSKFTALRMTNVGKGKA